MSRAFAIAADDLAVDRQLADIGESFRFLLDVSPVNVDEARERFLGSSADEPAFEYRALEDDTDVLRAELDAVDVESVTDPTLAHLVQAKRRELELQIDMLAARNTPDFRALSIELYGTVSPALLDQAHQIMAAVDGARPRRRDCLDAEAFAELAEQELAHYRATDPDLDAHVQIREDCSGVMVTDGQLLVPRRTRVDRRRATALLHHEIGTHILTYLNGCRQPLRLLAVGLAGYEETQEGLALFAEYLCDGLAAARLRQIAARVVAVHEMVEGASFRAVHDDLGAAGFSPTGAFTIAMRVFRSGGFTKDLVYLRGLDDLVAYVRAGRDLDVLWLGKLPLADAPLVEQLRDRGVLSRPLLRPRYLDDPGAIRRLHSLSHTGDVLDLVEG